MPHKNAQIMQPGGGKNHVIVVDLAGADFTGERIEAGLMAEFIDGARLGGLADLSVVHEQRHQLYQPPVDSRGHQQHLRHRLRVLVERHELFRGHQFRRHQFRRQPDGAPVGELARVAGHQQL